MKKWIPGAELLVRWTISHHDLVEIVMKGDVAAYNPDDLSQYDVDVDADLQNYARFLMGKQGVYLTATMFAKKGFDWHRDEFKKDKIRSLIPAVGGLLFKIEDVVEYERNHNLQLNADHEMPSVPLEPQYYFIKKNVVWEVGFDGKKASIRDLIGMTYIVYILQRLGKKEVPVHYLYRVAHPLLPEGPMSVATAADNELHTPGFVRVLTPKKKNLIMDKYNALQAEREVETDMEKREDIEEQMDELAHYLKDESKNTDMASHNNQRIQASVKKAIDRAREAIRKAGLENLAHHLEKNIKPGGEYSYKYTGDLHWEFTE